MSVTERFRGRQGGTLADLSRPRHHILTGEIEMCEWRPPAEGWLLEFAACRHGSWRRDK